MAKQIIQRGLLALDPKEPSSVGLALGIFWTVCARCSGVHVNFNRSHSELRSCQGYRCAISVSADGSTALGHYGSHFDGVHSVMTVSARAAVKGADPLCDACLAEMVLKGLAFPLGWWAEMESSSNPSDVSPEDAAVCVRRELQHFLELRASELGRLTL